MTDQYNTKLTPSQELEFKQWVKDASRLKGRNIAKDMYDYDLKGFWLNGGEVKANNSHGPDTYKKPNHPTFSDESIYHGAPDIVGGGKYMGGKWGGDDKKGITFTPTKEMLSKTRNIKELMKYMMDREPGVKVVLPK